MQELDMIVLTRDLVENGLREGDVGAIVHCYADGLAYEVEFVTAAGATLAVVTLNASDVRPVSGSEILHVRSLAGVA
jgi:hypothetical protein